MYTANPTHPLVFAPGRSALRSVAGASAYTVLRVVVGVVMAAHGSQKLLDLAAFRAQVGRLGIPMPEVAAPLAMAGELLGGLGLILGLLTPIAAFGVLATMLVAIVSVHIEHGLFAQNRGFEYPLTLASAALCFMINGAGPFSCDAILARVAQKSREARLSRRQDPAFEPAPSRPSGHHVPISPVPINPVIHARTHSFRE